MTSSRRATAVLGAVIVAAVVAPAVSAYLKVGTRVGANVVQIKWPASPINYFVTNVDVPGVNAAQFQGAFQRAFDTWSQVPTATLSSHFAGFTGAEPLTDDGVSVFGFKSRPDLDRTLAATKFVVDTQTGAVIESDIFVNTAFNWSVAANGEGGRFDLESIAVHELGHLLGLGHSLLGETELQAGGTRKVIAKRAVMFPFSYPAGNIEDRTLEADDIAGISDIYSTPAFDTGFGAVAGRVTLNGGGIFGAHVTAFNRTTGQLVGGFSLNANGDFVIGGLTAGLYVVRAEPMDDADVGSFFDDGPVVNINFKPTFLSQLVAVPAGGSSVSVEIKVTSK